MNSVLSLTCQVFTLNGKRIYFEITCDLNDSLSGSAHAHARYQTSLLTSSYCAPTIECLLLTYSSDCWIDKLRIPIITGARIQLFDVFNWQCHNLINITPITAVRMLTNAHISRHFFFTWSKIMVLSTGQDHNLASSEKINFIMSTKFFKHVIMNYVASL